MKHCPICDREFDQGDRCPDDGSALVERRDEADPLLGVTLKETYRIEEKLGEGGMGAVYRAVQLPLMRSVAVKVVKPAEPGATEPIKRFFREAQQLSSISHPNVVQLHDFGNTAEGLVYFVMEHLRGAELADAVVERRPLPLTEVVSLVEQMCAGVGAAHAAGLVHRDLKPANIFLARTSDGGEVVKVLDFGIAKSEDSSISRLTQTGAIVGTVGFIAPEVISGEAEASAVSDVYALGAIFYFSLTGRLAYDGPSAHTILVKQISEPPAPIDCELLGYPERFEEVARRAMARQPAERYQSAAELAAAVRRAAGLGDSGEGAPGPGASTLSTQPLQTAPLSAPTSARSSVETRTMAGTPPPDAAPPDRVTEREPAAAEAEAKTTRRRGAVFVAATAALAAAVLVGWWWLGGKSSGVNITRDVDAASAAVAAAPDPSPAVRGVSDDRVTLGLSAAFSGPARDKGRAIRVGLETALREINDDGGVHGRRLDLKARDDGYQPERSAQNARQLIEEEQVFALVGNQGSGGAALVAPMAPAQRFILLGACTGIELLEQDPPARYVFNLRARYSDEAVALLRYLVKVREVAPQRIALLAQEGRYGDEVHDDVQRALRELGHPRPDAVLTARYAHNSLDVDAATKLLLRNRARVDALVMVATARPAANLIKRLRDAGMQPLFASVSGVDADALAEELQEIAPGHAEGIVVTQVVPHHASEATGVRRYRAQLQRYFPEERPGFFSLEGYLVGRVLIEGLRLAGRALDTEALVDALESIRELDLGTGMVCSFGPSHHQCSRKVWGTVLDAAGEIEMLLLE